MKFDEMMNVEKNLMQNKCHENNKYKMKMNAIVAQYIIENEQEKNKLICEIDIETSERKK